MVNLEKSMFFIPNRLHVRGREMFVSFNIAPIPLETIVSRISLHVQIPAPCSSLSLRIQALAGGWDEGLMKTGYVPPAGETIGEGSFPVLQQEIVIDLQAYEQPWRFDSGRNHGIYLQLLEDAQAWFEEKKPPYLVVVTD
ncbi:hypothetical protein G3578_11210 [Brevibacillus sp. SYP-B805]|uniref:hypothetical protein n=1 Tax=Brevibacillus sp. SYP-B805 TaxID=1578199 RepID=UPI0013EB1AE5|nr:hypothetical protein [Brevibacillus sp. SYP-B805]NGQ95722.1 hypothetical protein [Brevibacillus sp. SYP-B805]